MHLLRPREAAQGLCSAGHRLQGRDRGGVPLLPHRDGDRHAGPGLCSGRRCLLFASCRPFEHRRALQTRGPLSCHHQHLLQFAGRSAGHHLHRQVSEILEHRQWGNAQSLHGQLASARSGFPSLQPAGFRRGQFQRSSPAGERAERDGPSEAQGGDRGPGAEVRRHGPLPSRRHQKWQYPCAGGFGCQHAEIQVQGKPCTRRCDVHHLRASIRWAAAVPVGEHLGLLCDHH
mmetsp:Transcript_46040/g.107652  ORF Transcript_46040/g.107652 Transcript_46040/m.107652 type:complete len:231 (-) Transcript_46040:489-1181(-)